MQKNYLWGLSGGYWHALTRHDPDFSNSVELVESPKLTAIARRKDPEAAPVLAQRVKPGVAPAPGTGASLCGLKVLPLDRLGVDPEDGDVLCVSCAAQANA